MLVATALHKPQSSCTSSVSFESRELIKLKQHLHRCFTYTNTCFLFQGPPVVSVASKRKKGDKSKGKGGSCIGELLVIPFLSKFPVPSHGEDASSKAVQK